VFRGTCDAPAQDGAVGGCAHVTGAPPPQGIGEVPTATGPVASGDVARVKGEDPACRHDPIEIATDGAAGITFTEDTAFNLSNDACMAPNEFARDPNRTSKSARLNLNQGAFTLYCRQGNEERRSQDRYACRKDPRHLARSRNRRPDARLDLLGDGQNPGRELARRVLGR